MILASWNAIPKKKVDFLKGPAKVYDGVFDEDVFTANYGLRSTSTFSVLCTFDVNTGGTQAIYAFGSTVSTFSFQLVFFDNNLTVGIRVLNSNPNCSVIFPVGSGKHIVGVNWDGSLDASGWEICLDGINVATSVIANTLADDFLFETNHSIGDRFNFGDKFNGAIKQLEVLNRQATAIEMQQATDPITGGSFRSAGIAHNSGEYLFALNTDQTDGNPPTTFANTPQYTITSFGGAQYVPYESL